MSATAKPKSPQKSAKSSTSVSKCDVCDLEQAEIRCSDCNSVHVFCRCCFDLTHRSPQKKGHKPQALSKAMGRMSAQLQLFRCAVHPLEARKYVCGECNDTTCPDCFVVGKHVGHTPKLFEEAVNVIVNTMGTELEANKRVLVRAREAVWMLAEERKIEQTAFAAYVGGISEKFAVVLELMKKRMETLVSAVTAEAERVDKYLAEMGSNAETVLRKTEDAVKKLGESLLEVKKTINPDNYCKYRDMGVEVGRSKNEKMLMEISMAQLLDFSPSANLPVEGLYQADTKELRFEFKKASSDDNGTWVTVRDEIEGKPLGESYLLNKSVRYLGCNLCADPARFRVAFGLPWNFAICEVHRPGLVISPQSSRFSLRNTLPADSFWSVVKDEFSPGGRLYVARSFNGCKSLSAYNSLSDLVQGEKGEEIKLEQAFDGWYVAVKNGHLFHSVSGTNMVGVTDLVSGKLLDMLKLPGAATSGNGQGAFKHRGYSDIALFADPRSGKVLVMYETESEHEFKMAELRETGAGLELGSSWTLAKERKGAFCYAFVYDRAAYFGRKHDVGTLQSIYSMSDGCMNESAELRVIPSGEKLNIHYMTVMPSENAVVVCTSEPFQVRVYDVRLKQ